MFENIFIFVSHKDIKSLNLINPKNKTQVWNVRNSPGGGNFRLHFKLINLLC